MDVILAVGGGSVIAFSKAVAAATYYDGDSWDIIANPMAITNALPVISVTTIAATDSETDFAAVISNPAKKQKLVTAHPAMTPWAAFMDPVRTYSVSAMQTSAGAADTMSHALENYFALPDESFLPDSIAESVIKAAVKYAPVALAQPDNYEARA